MNTNMKRRHFVAALAGSLTTVVVTIFAGPLAQPALAHEANCPVCALSVVQDTEKQDNEVKLRYGRKRLEYRCVYCAMMDAQKELKDGEIAIAAPSEKKGEPVVIKRVNGKWSAPEGAVFAAKKATHSVCQITYRAFHTKAGFEVWVKNHPAQFDKDSEPITLEQMVDLTSLKQ